MNDGITVTAKTRKKPVAIAKEDVGRSLMDFMQAHCTTERDEDELFLLSLAPALKRIAPKPVAVAKEDVGQSLIYFMQARCTTERDKMNCFYSSALSHNKKWLVKWR